MLLWIRPTLCAQVAFLTAVPTNNVLVWIRTLVLTVTSFLDALATAFPCLALSCPSCPSCPPVPKLSTSIGSEVLFGATVLSANWLRRASMSAWISLRTCSYVISRARFMARCCSNSLGTRASSTAVSMSSSRTVVVAPLDFAPLVPADQFFQFLNSCG